MKCSCNHSYYRFVFLIVNVVLVIYNILTFDRTVVIDTVSAIVTYIFDKIRTSCEKINKISSYVIISRATIILIIITS